MTTDFHEHAFTIRLHDTDAAGLLFFGHIFRHAHDAFEAFMDTIGFPVDLMIRDGRMLLPLTHAEADYRRPLRHGDTVRVLVSVLEIRRRSFAIGYRFIDRLGDVAATARTVHVEVSADIAPVMDLSESLRLALSTYLADDAQLS
ncbi:thioesterase [Thiocystis minor]|uniref:acyl-CoA thioesterase n=1 Tax=Thiocystis minor TaxID=61597 RepID=UPI0019143029|nr:acyl-CoA thioesterase [Thiocystis minor]MBK5964065.1 thioesterase [Thiocystis minor]